ncbi:MAG: hypothetical protein RLN82_10540 [Pseudomonadales bacterium]
MTNDDVEFRLQHRLRQTELQIDAETCHQLHEIREAAIARQSRWFGEYSRHAVAGIVGLLAVSALISSLQPNRTDQGQGLADTGENIEVLMEDPNFYLWLDESGRLVAER